MIKSKGYAGWDANTPLKYYEFERRALGEFDVHIKIHYCGVCHSDIHTVRNEWGGAIYPLVPGHEIVGVVAKVGAKVIRFQEGEVVGVGCMVGSCGHCDACSDDLEQYCPATVFTYNSMDADGTVTKGGYSDNIVVHEKFVLNMPKHLNLAAAAPLLCAGITTYSPLKHWQIGENDTIGVVGLGGLGHMAVKFARAFGAHVVVFTASPQKRADALRMGADEVVLSTDVDEMAKHSNRFDFILDTTSARHHLEAYMALLKPEKTLCMLGIAPEPLQIGTFSLIKGRKKLSGSLIGGIAETQEMLDYCGKHHITCDIELIPIQYLNEAYERMLNSDVKYRFVVDMSSLQHT